MDLRASHAAMTPGGWHTARPRHALAAAAMPTVQQADRACIHSSSAAGRPLDSVHARQQHALQCTAQTAVSRSTQRSWCCRAAKGGAAGSTGSRGGSSSRSGSGGSVQQRGPPDVTNHMDDMEDVIVIEGDEGAGDDDDEDDEGLMTDFTDDEYDDEFEEGDEEEEDEGFLGAGSDDDPGPEVLTGNVEWGDTALKVAEAVLQQPENDKLALYLFRVLVPTKTIEVRLDKLDDVYGSPGLEDIERFSRALAQGLEAELGAEAAGDISFEVSSPGAERTLIIPQDLERFKDLPMRVEFRSDVGLLTTLVLRFAGLDQAEGVTSWELADVRANQGVKGRGLTKKQRMQRYDVPLEALERVRIHVDF